MQRHALLIDAMGTLVQLADPVPALVAGVRQRTGVALGAERARTALRAEIAFYREHMHEGSDARGVERLHVRCAGVLRSALPTVLHDLPDAEMTALLLASLRFEPFADARPALVRARRAGARVIVVSNWDASLGDVLARVGLSPLLDAVLTSAAVGAAKPDPAIFAAAVALARARPRACLHVGDSASDDLAGAQAAGIPAVLLDRSGVRGPPTIASLDALDVSSWR